MFGAGGRIYLSGGLDSVSVAAVAAENSQRKGLPPPWALSLGFPDECNEEEIERGVAKNLGLPQVSGRHLETLSVMMACCWQL